MRTLHRGLAITLMAVVAACLLSCNTAKDTARTGEGGANGAAGIAGKMKNGTVGDTDPDTGDSKSGGD